VPTGPVPSDRSLFRGRGRRRRCRPVAPPTPIAWTTPLIRRRQQHSLRRRRRAAGVVDDRSPPGMPCVANELRTLSGASRNAGPLPALSSPTTRAQTGRVSRRPARASPLPLLNGADRGGSTAASTPRCEPSRPLPGRNAGDKTAPTPEGRLSGVRAGGAGSVSSISVR